MGKGSKLRLTSLSKDSSPLTTKNMVNSLLKNSNMRVLLSNQKVYFPVMASSPLKMAKNILETFSKDFSMAKVCSLAKTTNWCMKGPGKMDFTMGSESIIGKMVPILKVST